MAPAMAKTKQRCNQFGGFFLLFLTQQNNPRCAKLQSLIVSRMRLERRVCAEKQRLALQLPLCSAYFSSRGEALD